jgi:hypothetical protein
MKKILIIEGIDELWKRMRYKIFALKTLYKTNKLHPRISELSKRPMT